MIQLVKSPVCALLRGCPLCGLDPGAGLAPHGGWWHVVPAAPQARAGGWALPGACWASTRLLVPVPSIGHAEGGEPCSVWGERCPVRGELCPEPDAW